VSLIELEFGPKQAKAEDNVNAKAVDDEAAELFDC
jgi:hypothetical protein